MVEPSRHRVPTAKQRRAGMLWALVPVGLLMATLLGLGTLVAIAVDDPGFAVEPDYYQKAVLYDEERAQRALNAQLGWQPDVTVTPTGARNAEVQVALQDPHERAIAGAHLTAVAFHNARAGDVIELVLKEGEPGVYSSQANLIRPGLWELRLIATRDGQRFTSTERFEIHSQRHKR